MLIPLPYKILALVFIVGGTFAAGYKKGTEAGEVMIQKAANEAEQLKIELEKEQNNIKEKVVTEYVDKVKIVKEKEYVLQQAATNNVPSQYNLSNGWVYIHDHATSTQGGVPDPAATADATPSDVKDNQALLTILTNYSVCLQNAQQLIGLQNWVLETEKSVTKQNESRGIHVPWEKK